MTPKQRILLDILRLTQKPGRFRTFLIGILFPEFEQIVGKLSDLSTHVEYEDGKIDCSRL